MNNAKLINQDSGNVEYYTNIEIISLVNKMFGEIDLDPASCELANTTVQAKEFFTEEQNGLEQPWVAAKLWMNHPFTKGEKSCKPKKGRKKMCKKKNCIPKYKKGKLITRGHCITKDIPSNLDWIAKLLSEHFVGNIKESLNITFCSSSEKWCQLLLNSGVTCFINGRTQYNDQNGQKTNQVTKGSIITYIGPRADLFKEIFSTLGVVK